MSGLSGINALADVARAARLAGGEAPKKLKRGLSGLGPPAKKAVQTSALAKMPSGYGPVLAKTTRVQVRTDMGFTTAGVTVVTSAAGQRQKRDIPAINKGRLRHPVHGHRRRKWVTQRVPAGFWDDAMNTTSDEATARVRAVLDDINTILRGR